MMMRSDEEIFSLAAGVAVAFASAMHDGENAASGEKPHQGIFSRNRTIASGATWLKCQKTHWDSGTVWPETVLGPTIYGYDGHGNVRFLTNTSGTVGNTYTLDAFGAQIASTVTTANTYLYSGERFDSNLNLYQLRARFYNMLTGRFETMDPGPARSVASCGSQADDIVHPGALHKYVYAQNDPVNHIDPSGRDIEEEGELSQISEEARPTIRELECDALYEEDLVVCRALGSTFCYAQAAERYAACLVGRPIPPFPFYLP
jgi:RHS repeat-associated protein